MEHTPQRVMVETQDRTLLLDLTAVRELLPPLDRLFPEDQRTAQMLLDRTELSLKELHKLVLLLQREVTASECPHGLPLYRDFTLLKPLRIRNVVITHSEDQRNPEPGELLMRLELGMAFGSGRHPTTELSIEAMLDTPMAGARVGDVTSGSGILCVLAGLLGARSVTAADLWAPAVANTCRNAALNGLDQRIQARRGSLEVLANSYDVILSNTWSLDTAWALLFGLAVKLPRGGILISRRFPSVRRDSDFDAALQRLGFRTLQNYERDTWSVFRAVRERET